MRIALGLSALVLAATGVACSDQTENNESGTAGRADELGECADVWIDGETLDAGYQGCSVDGQPELPSVVTCESGDQFTTYDDRFFAVLGGQITEASAGSTEYEAAVEECNAA